MSTAARKALLMKFRSSNPTLSEHPEDMQRKLLDLLAHATWEDVWITLHWPEGRPQEATLEAAICRLRIIEQDAAETLCIRIPQRYIAATSIQDELSLIAAAFTQMTPRERLRRLNVLIEHDRGDDTLLWVQRTRLERYQRDLLAAHAALVAQCQERHPAL